MNRLKAHKHFMQFLVSTSTSQRQRKALLSSASVEQMNIIAEIFANILAHSIDLKKNDIKRLGEHASIIRRVAQKQLQDSSRHKLLVKHAETVVTVLSIVKKYLPF